jgi:hypothetical protein
MRYIRIMETKTKETKTMKLAELTRDVEIEVEFSSYDLQDKTTFDSYKIKSKMKAGVRRFKTMKAAKNWIDYMNKEHGAGTAIPA